MSNWLSRIKDVWPWSSSHGHEVPVTSASHGPDPERLQDRPVAAPAVDVLENDQEMLLLADVPGAHADNTRIYWDDRRGLQLHVERAGPDEPSRSPDWYRAFQLPPHLEPHEARSTVKAGVLRVSIPRRPDTRPVAIPVRGEG